MSAVEMSCVVPVPKSVKVWIGQRWQFFTKQCERVEVSVWSMSSTWPDGARRVHLRESNGISWEALDTEMLNDPTWTLLSNHGDKR